LTVHKKVFTDASPYFAAAFNGRFKEAKDSILRLTEEDPVTFSWVVKGVYGNSFGFYQKQDMTLLRYAKLEIALDKYQLDELKNNGSKDLRSSCMKNWVNNTSVEDLSFILGNCPSTAFVYQLAILYACDLIKEEPRHIWSFKKCFQEHIDLALKIGEKLAEKAGKTKGKKR